MEPRTTRLMFTSIKLEKKLIFCLLFFLLVTTARATEYIVSPAPNDEFGVSVAGEKVVELEVTQIPYWQFLLWLAAMQILSIIDVILYFTKFIFIILGFRAADHPSTVGTLKRKYIYTFIKTCPGTCISEIESNMSLSRGSLRYHLSILEAENMIEAHNDCRKIRYFQNNSTYSEEEKRVISVLQNEMTRKIVLKILKEECSTNGDLARTTGVSKSAITRYMKQLNESGLINENKMGKSTIYSINPVYRDAIEKHT
ncbi:winged helix-turn-helix transcriptional regulator [Methanosarcina sp.]|uniref:winged helix-turn-helix transcriptional regulator n=1 Tax=Methanosarcina sp. TaxID=2213 RepID=UPI002988155F|nr:ArsR family transcriptional regulator [Methanosarcina sp.]MDW5549700.1 ArsR family transcriptional regulator [Methanosarcina sp.]MDW5552899.1 ArsR family transcriptional regulator [Methanosarcina sp.]MDW5558087.1 ArsR family transcriptional regulator [Methanosarcina sp.]